MKVSDHGANARFRIVERVLASFAARENASVDEILQLARDLPHAIAGLASLPEVETNVAYREPLAAKAPIKPAVPIEQSVSEDEVTCLCCGRSFTMLKRHLKAEHGLTEPQYREQFELPDEHPLTAPSYSERKAAYAKRIGLGKHSREELPAPDAESTS